MHPDANPAEARAIDWLIRLRDPVFDDWDGFADWLGEDPGHAAIFDAIASLDHDLDALPPAAKPMAMTMPTTPRRTSRRGWFGGAIAAALVAVIGLSTLNPFGNANRIETAAGEHRTIELADGSRIEINGGSVVEIDKDRPRFARLEAGEAMFHVVHRDDDPFVVETGGDRLVDLGTASTSCGANARHRSLCRRASFSTIPTATRSVLLQARRLKHAMMTANHPLCRTSMLQASVAGVAGCLFITMPR